MKPLQFLLLCFFISPLSRAQGTSVANFSGHWIASAGKVSSTIGLNDTCSKVEIIIEQNDRQILTKLYNAECKVLSSKWGPIVQEIRDGKVFEEDVEVGTINADTLITVSNSGTYQYAYNLKLKNSNDGTIIMDSYYGTKGGLGAIVTEASLKIK